MSLFAALSLLAAAPFTDLADIDRAVAEFASAPAGHPGGASAAVDRRLRLAPCAVPLALSWYGAARQTVLVQCPLPGGWRLFVPLAGAAGGGQPTMPIVARGEAVTITVSGAGFAVSRAGEALEPGAQGAWIRVRPADSKSAGFRARVLSPGVVGMELP